MMLKRKALIPGILFFCLFLISSGIVPKQSATGTTPIVYSADINSQEPVFTLPDFNLNPSALRFAKEYVKKNGWGLQRIKDKKRSSLTVINSVFDQYDIPPELKYMAIVESNLNSTVCNSTGATGIWQLMPFTANELGLKITDDYDERLLVKKSSVAVAKYLKQLYDQFGDWLLVVAAYNAGPAKISRAIETSGSNNFWQLQKYLPLETSNHVKRFISIAYYFEEQNNAVDQVKNGSA